MRSFALLAGLAVTFQTHFAGADPDDALAAYKAADYIKAIPLLKAAVAENPKDAPRQAALLSALAYQGAVDEAADLADADAGAFPSSPDVLAARGEFAFYMGDMPGAEKLWVAAANLDNTNARAYYGLSRLYHAASLYRTSRLRCLKAHDLDPDDALITKAWLGVIPAEKRKELLPVFVASHPWLYRKFDLSLQTEEALKEEVNQRKPFELDGERKEEDVHLIELRDGPTRVRGVGLEFSMNGEHPIRLLLDTGASGILLRQAVIDKAGLDHLGLTELRGAGDKGSRSGFVSVADTCQIGPLKYKTCVIEALEGKGRIGGFEDGLIGADMFASYLIYIDFQKHQMHLTPLAARPYNAQGYDRQAGADRAGFTPVFRFGHHLMVSTKLNGKSTGLFLLDTGATISNVDSTFARLSTKIRGNDYLHVHGISGEVKDVFEADKAVLEFSMFRQQNLGLTAFNLNTSPEHQEVRMDGILGLPVLAMFRLTLDYRNGLVKFDYVFK